MNIEEVNAKAHVVNAVYTPDYYCVDYQAEPENQNPIF